MLATTYSNVHLQMVLRPYTMYTTASCHGYFTKHMTCMSKNSKQNTWAKHPRGNTPGKFVEEVLLKYYQTGKYDYLQISFGLTQS